MQFTEIPPVLADSKMTEKRFLGIILNNIDILAKMLIMDFICITHVLKELIGMRKLEIYLVRIEICGGERSSTNEKFLSRKSSGSLLRGWFCVMQLAHLMY